MNNAKHHTRHFVLLLIHYDFSVVCFTNSLLIIFKYCIKNFMMNLTIRYVQSVSHATMFYSMSVMPKWPAAQINSLCS